MQAHQNKQDSIHRFLEASLDGVIIHRGLRVVFANQQFYQLLDLDHHQRSFVGLSILDLFGIADRKKLHRHLSQLQQQSHKNLQLELLSSKQQPIPISLKSLPIHYRGLPCTVTIIHRLQGQQPQTQLVESERMETLSLLSAGVAHEINNPLTYISLSLDELHQSLPLLKQQLEHLQKQLAQELSPRQSQNILPYFQDGHLSSKQLDELIEGVEDAMVGSQRITDIVQDLRVFSHNHGDEETISLNKVIRSAFQLCRHRIQRNANVQLQLQDQAWIRADEGKIKLVLINLLVNASDAIPLKDRGTITIRLQTEKEKAVIEIIQNEESAIKELQEQQKTSSETQKSKTESNLRLTISREIIEKSNGSLDICSTPDQKNTFTLSFPLGNPKEEYRSPQRHRLLVIEEEEALRRQLHQLLSKNFIVQTAPSGRIAFSIIQQEKEPDLILSNLLIADGSGIELYHWLERYHPHLCKKMLYLTTGEHDPQVQRFLQSISNLVMEKPVPPQLLLQIINKLCHSKTASETKRNERRAGHRFPTRDISGKLYLGSQLHPIQLVDFSRSGIRAKGICQDINYKNHHMITMRIQNRKTIGEVAAHLQFSRLADQDPCFQIQAMSNRDQHLYQSWLQIST